MNQEIKNRIEHLKNFLLNIKSIVDNPYTQEIDTKSLVKDLCAFVSELHELSIEEDTTPSENTSVDE